MSAHREVENRQEASPRLVARPSPRRRRVAMGTFVLTEEAVPSIDGRYRQAQNYISQFIKPELLRQAGGPSSCLKRMS